MEAGSLCCIETAALGDGRLLGTAGKGGFAPVHICTKLVVPVLKPERLLDDEAHIIAAGELDSLTHDAGQLRAFCVGIHGRYYLGAQWHSRHRCTKEFRLQWAWLAADRGVT